MADLGKENIGASASTSTSIEDGNVCTKGESSKGEEISVKPSDKKEEETKKTEEEKPKLPKLSSADFRAYNSMAEHMEYFVRLSPSICSGRKHYHKHTRIQTRREINH